MIRNAAFLAALLVLPACATTGEGAGADLRGIEWQAIDIAGQPPAASRAPTLRLQRGRTLAGGEGGCNIWSGEYRLGRGRLALSDISSTRRACPAPLMTQETAYLALLQQVDRYRLWDDGSLVLATPEGRTITFRRAEAAAAD